MRGALCSTYKSYVAPSQPPALTFHLLTVSWNWGSGKPGGEVAEKKKEGEIAIQSKKGNTIKKNASPDNPAIHVKRSGNDVVKRASELNVEKKGSGGGGGGEKRKKEDDDEKKDDKEEGLEKVRLALYWRTRNNKC